MVVVDYEILVQDIVPPIGGVLKFGATIHFLVVKEPGGNKRLNPDLGETYGKTREEARAKMQTKFDEWLANQA